MEIQPNELGRILDAIEQIREHLAHLESRVAQLENGPAKRGAAPDGADTAPAARIDHETMMSIAAAIAAALGKSARIRSIRLLHSDTWAQQGRATLQAIHGQRRPKER